MGKKNNRNNEIKSMQESKPQIDPFIIIILCLTILVPIVVLPNYLDNIFNLPKTFLLIIGAFLMIAIYCIRCILGGQVQYPGTYTPLWLLLIVCLNFISFFYTQNYYYTKVAVLMNSCALSIFYFTSIFASTKKSVWILKAIAVSGVLVALVAWLQYYDSSLLPQWLKTGKKLTGLIGNSNYLGAFLLFPLFSLSGLILLLKGKPRFVPAIFLIFVFGALIFARSRASWLGFFIALPLFLFLINRIYRLSVFEYIRLNFKLVLTYAAGFIIIISIFWNIMPDRFQTDMVKKSVRISTFTQRLQFFHASLELLKENPVFGTGLWSYRNCVYSAQAKIMETNPDYFKDADRPNKPKRVHNEYLETLNDGGFLAAGVLLLFFLTIMGHGLKVIRDTEVDHSTRVISATAFSMMVAIMIDAFFFFPFRINTTLFMTALTLGLLEGTYVHQYKLILKTQKRKYPFPTLLVFLIIFLLTSVFWFRGLKPILAEMEHFEFRKALFHQQIKQAESHILKAISYDAGNTRYHVFAAMMYFNNFKNYPKANDFIEESLVNFIGDNTLWGVYYTKGLIKFQMGSIFEAKKAFRQALYYNPLDEPSLKKLEQIEMIFEKHDKLCIQLK